jgi:hypothetical protein
VRARSRRAGRESSCAPGWTPDRFPVDRGAHGCRALAFGTSSAVAATPDSNDCGARLKAAGAAHKTTSSQRAALKDSSGRCSAGSHQSAAGTSGCICPLGVRTEPSEQEVGELSCLAPRGPDVEAPRGSGTQRHPCTPGLLRSLGVREATNGCGGGEIGSATPGQRVRAQLHQSQGGASCAAPTNCVATCGSTPWNDAGGTRRRRPAARRRPSTTARTSAPTRWSG